MIVIFRQNLLLIICNALCDNLNFVVEMLYHFYYVVEQTESIDKISKNHVTSLSQNKKYIIEALFYKLTFAFRLQSRYNFIHWYCLKMAKLSLFLFASFILGHSMANEDYVIDEEIQSCNKRGEAMLKKIDEFLATDPLPESMVCG